MKEIEINTTNLQRITVIDALRGFALLGVILMHMIDRFGYEITNLSNSSPSTLDTYVHWFSNLVIRGKFISIFSFLFGLSFFIQMERASKKGKDAHAEEHGLDLGNVSYVPDPGPYGTCEAFSRQSLFLRSVSPVQEGEDHPHE